MSRRRPWLDDHTPPLCPYDGTPAELVSPVEVYGPAGRGWTRVWVCRALGCDARVGSHGRDGRPLGSLARSALRARRRAVHARFDPIHKEGPSSRSEAYAWLAQALELPAELCHVALFDAAGCERALAALAHHPFWAGAA